MSDLQAAVLVRDQAEPVAAGRDRRRCSDARAADRRDGRRRAGDVRAVGDLERLALVIPVADQAEPVRADRDRVGAPGVRPVEGGRRRGRARDVRAVRDLEPGRRAAADQAEPVASDHERCVGAGGAERRRRRRAASGVLAVGDPEQEVREVDVGDQAQAVRPDGDRGIAPDVAGAVDGGLRRPRAAQVGAMGGPQALELGVEVADQGHPVGADRDRRVGRGGSRIVDGRQAEPRVIGSGRAGRSRRPGRALATRRPLCAHRAGGAREAPRSTRADRADEPRRPARPLVPALAREAAPPAGASQPQLDRSCLARFAASSSRPPRAASRSGRRRERRDPCTRGPPRAFSPCAYASAAGVGTQARERLAGRLLLGGLLRRPVADAGLLAVDHRSAGERPVVRRALDVQHRVRHRATRAARAPPAAPSCDRRRS